MGVTEVALRIPFFIIRIETEGSGNLHFIVIISSFVKAYASIESKMESRF